MMKPFAKILLGISSAFLLMPFMSNLHAVEHVVNVVQSTTTLAATRAGTAQITWRISYFPAFGLAPNAFTSTTGILYAGNPVDNLVVGTIPRVLTRTMQANTTASLRESLLIPISAIYKTIKLGRNQIFYRRTFLDNTGNVPATTNDAQFSLLSAPLTGIYISQLVLQFDDGSPIRLLKVKQALTAKASVEYSGNGLVRGIWEVAGPASTAGKLFFRPLRRVQQNLLAADRYEFNSPPLPTDAIGLYVVRLRISDPEPGFEAPIIRYFVSRDGTQPRKPVSIGLSEPSAYAALIPLKRFRWQPVTGARIYKLEFYKKPEPTLASSLPSMGAEPGTTGTAVKGPPVTGMLVSGKETQLALSRAAHRHLKRGNYLWRVLAIDKDGRIIGVSGYREARVR